MVDVTAVEDERIRLYLAAAFESRGFADSLQVIADGVRELAGFDVAAVSVARGADEFEYIAVSSGYGDLADLIGKFYSRSTIEADLERAERWGRFRFVPPEQNPSVDSGTWISDVQYPDIDDAWHPMNMLVAPLCDEQGSFVGLLSVDVPLDGRRPGPEARRVLDVYAAHAERVIVRALEQARLAEQVRLITAARGLVSAASARMGLQELLDECKPALLQTFRARGMWIEVVPDPGQPSEPVTALVSPTSVHVPRPFVAIALRVATECWQDQRVAVVSHRRLHRAVLTPDEQRDILAFLSDIRRSSLLMVPLGVGRECLGVFVLTRAPEDEEWSDVECEVAADVGRELGTAVMNARLHERDRSLLARLEELDRYKEGLIATISHELRTPLTVIRGQLELLEDIEPLTATGAESLRAVQRNTDRLRRLVEDLLLHSQMNGAPRPDVLEDVDMVALVTEAIDVLGAQARSRSITLTTRLPPRAPVTGSATELRFAVTNLVSNAVKYSDAGGQVDLALVIAGDRMRLTVRDTGIGISAEDQQHLFEEFFRSADPRARDRPGTGLGLSIAGKAIQRAGGTITVDSSPQAGSTFTVDLPTATTIPPGGAVAAIGVC